MRSLLLLLPVLVLAGCLGAGSAKAPDALNPTVLQAVQEAVFEVVVAKPQQDSLAYEKPLPMELIPYAIRTDRYYSIGTAFAIGPNRFVTAAHVLNLGVRSQFGEPALRYRDGSVYAIDKIYKYASNRDFVLFSLRDFTGSAHLPVNPSPPLNERVFAVGNALGQGVVVRDGLYTSNTPEDLDGEWKWLRFSAAASPGNSGGPLLDKEGRVIGVVTMKSPNENLNFALPIAEVLNAPEKTGTLKQMMQYVLDNMDMISRDTLHQEIPLPKTYAELDKELQAHIARFSESLLKDLLAKHRDSIFPRGPGSQQLLHKTYSSAFPQLIAKGDDGNWDAFSPEEKTDADLGNNGSLTYGTLGNSILVFLKKPDDVPLKTLFADSKLFMDLLLKGIYSTRQIGSEKIKITSLGKAAEEHTHTDAYGRKWLVKTWLIEYNDRKVVTLSLPVPGGCVTMLRTDQTWDVDTGHLPDLKVLADFINLSYYGTLRQWREFLKMKDLLPAPFAHINISFDYGRSLRYRSQRLDFRYDPDLLSITEESDLKLSFAYFPEDGKVRWDVGQVLVGDHKSNGTCFVVYRDIRPPAELGDNYRSDWEKMVKRQFPYNESAYFQKKQTLIAAVFDGKQKSSAAEPELLYDVYYVRDGSLDQEEMASRLRKFMKKMKVLEN